MKPENKQNIFFVLFAGAVLVMALIYFSVPERMEFIDFNMRWWKEFFGVLGAVTHIR